MRFLKWLKNIFSFWWHSFHRETENSPNTQRESPENVLLLSQSSQKKISRNESYLMALKNFTKWRQLQLAAKKQQEDNTNSEQNSSTDSSRNTSLQSIYEEIDPNHEESSKPASSSGASKCAIDHSYENGPHNSNNLLCKSKDSLLLYDTPNHSVVNQHNIIDDSVEYDETEYVLPYATESHFYEDSSKMFQSATTIDFFETFGTDCETGREGKLLITDLDKSNESGTNLSSNECNNDTEFLQYSSRQVMLMGNTNEIRFTSGLCMQNGDVDNIDITCLWSQRVNNNRNLPIQINYEILRKLRNANIVLLVGFVMDDTNSEIEALLIEPLTCSLHYLIHSNERNMKIPLDMCQKYAIQLTDAVTYLKKQKIIHTNICSENILLYNENSVIVKLSGFELSTIAVDDQNQKKYQHNCKSKIGIDYISCSAVRKEYCNHYYQAPELLSDTLEYVIPSHESDIYGICITLWEMVNIAVPYSNFTRSELIKVFALKNAQLPIYKCYRHAPFQQLFENGLQVLVKDRIHSSVALKDALRHIDISNDGTDNNTLNVCKCRSDKESRNHSSISSAVKKRKWQQFDGEEFSPITKFSSHLPWDVHNDSVDEDYTTTEMNQIQQDATDCIEQIKTTTNRETTTEMTPNRRLSVNIKIIKSRNGNNTNSNQLQTNNHHSPAEKDHGFCNNLNKSSTKENSVKYRVSKFESFATSSPCNTHNSSLYKSFTDRSESSISAARNDVHSSAIQKSFTQQYSYYYDSNNISGNDGSLHSKIERQFQLISTEDIYIDDDIPKNFNLGANFLLNFDN